VISQQFLDMLRCPDQGTRLTLADAALVEQLNAAITAGKLKNRSDQPVKRHFNGALLREDNAVAYPIVDEIPILLIDEGIDLAQNGLAVT